MLIRCLIQRLPISPALIHPRWCIATKLIAAPDWQPQYIEDMAFQGDPLPGHPEALTRIRLSVLRLLDIIKDLPAEEMGELANKFEDFEVAQMAILIRQAELRSLPEGAPFEVPQKARWQPPPKKKHGKANQRGKTSAEIAERAADVAEQELQKERQEEAQKQKGKVESRGRLIPTQPSGGVDLSYFLIQNKEPADEVDEDIEEDEEQPFDEPSVLYDEVLGGLEDEVVILEAGEDDDSWFNDTEVLHGTILGDPHQNIGEKEPVVTHSVPNDYEEPPPLLLHQSGRAARTRARRTYTQLARGNFTSILSDTDEGPSDTKPKEIVIPSKLKRPRQGASVDAHKAYKASTLAIRSPQAKRTRGDKKGKDPIEIDGRILEYYTCK